MFRKLRTTIICAVLLASLIAEADIASASTPLVRATVPYPVFSPDRDGYRDLLPVTYRLSRSARTTVRILRNGVVVRTLKASAYQYAGTYTVRWNGLTGTGSPAPLGTYRWIATAKRGTGTVASSGYVSLERRAMPSDRWVGFYVPNVPQDMSPLLALETTAGVQARVLNYFQNTTEGFTATASANAIARGMTPLITLEFWDPSAGVDQPSYRLSAITARAWDDYLHRYARDAKAFGQTVWLRPFHEMNGNWYPWAGTVNGNTPADFVPAWRHVHDIFVQEGATNVKFVWCPSSDSVPDTAANSFAAYWPGDAYVDYIALDGYNFGASTSWSTWRTFSQTFANAYKAVTALSPKPMFIAETGCSTMGGDKAAWIAAMFAAVPRSFPRLQGVVWFNVLKECDWRIESGPQALKAFSVAAAGF